MPDPTTPAAPASPMQGVPGFDLSSVVQRLQDQMASEIGQAQQQAAATRQRANAMPILARLFASPEQQLAARQQIMNEAMIPAAEVVQRHAAREQALREGLQAADVYGKDLQTRLAMEKIRPDSPMMEYIRANAPAGKTIPQGLSPAFLEVVDPQFKSMIEAYAKEQEGAKAGAEGERIRALTGPEAAAKRAEAAKSGAEAERTRALIEPEKTEKLAGAEKATAEAAHTRMLTSGEVVPGYSRGNIPIDEAEATKLTDQYRDFIKSKKAINRILELTGGDDFIVSPERRAQVQPQINNLVAELRGSTGIRQLAGPELEFAKKIIADPTALSVSNIARWSHNQTRLKSLAESLDRGWESTVRAKDLRRGGGERNAAPASTIKMKFPDGKVVPVHATRIEDAIRAGATRVDNGG